MPMEYLEVNQVFLEPALCCLVLMVGIVLSCWKKYQYYQGIWQVQKNTNGLQQDLWMSHLLKMTLILLLLLANTETTPYTITESWPAYTPPC